MQILKINTQNPIQSPTNQKNINFGFRQKETLKMAKKLFLGLDTVKIGEKISDENSEIINGFFKHMKRLKNKRYNPRGYKLEDITEKLPEGEIKRRNLVDLKTNKPVQAVSYFYFYPQDKVIKILDYKKGIEFSIDFQKGSVITTEVSLNKDLERELKSYTSINKENSKVGLIERWT